MGHEIKSFLGGDSPFSTSLIITTLSMTQLWILVQITVNPVPEIISEIEEETIPVVYYEELTTPTVAQSICDDTGAKMLLLHSCHNVTEEELEDGVTYLSLMEQNAANLKEGLD